MLPCMHAYSLAYAQAVGFILANDMQKQLDIADNMDSQW